MLQLLNTDPKDMFGVDLAQVLGPKAKRKHVSTFTVEELNARIKKLPEYVPTKSLGADPSIFQITNHLLRIIMSTGALKGIDLDWQAEDSLKTKGLVCHPDQFVPAAKIVKNNEVQRGIQLQNLVGKILFRFKPDAVQSGLARYSKKDDLYFLNDAQHRMIACIILGIREIPLVWKVSEKRSVDVKQYKYTNLSGLPATSFDKYRNRVQTIEVAIEEDHNFTVSKNTADPEEITSWGVYNILEEFDAECIEKGQTPTARQCTGVGNLESWYDEYGPGIFQRAIQIHTQVWYTKRLAQQNVRGICEFIKVEESKKTLKNDSAKVDRAIIEALLHRYPIGKGQGYGFYSDVIRAFNEATVGTDITVPYQSIVAAGLHKIIKITDPNTKWVPIRSNKKIVATNYLKTYRVPPKP